MSSVAAAPLSLVERSAEFERMQRALDWLGAHWRERPSLDEAAAAVGLSGPHFQRVFTRWAGVSPKTFLQTLAHAQARASLAEGATVLDATFDAGLSGPSRLHDLFIAQEGATPGQARRRGDGMTLRYGVGPSPFGRALLAIAPKGLCGLGFVDGEDEATALADLQRRWPAADWVRDEALAAAMAEQVFAQGPRREPISLLLMGPPFHVQVWKALLRIAPRRDRQLRPGRGLGRQSHRPPGHRPSHRRQPDLLPHPLPPRDRRRRPSDRLSLGPGPQGGHAGGGGAGVSGGGGWGGVNGV